MSACNDRPWAVLTTGATQLLTCLAAARQQGVAFEQLEVWSSFKPHPPLVAFVQEICGAFQVPYRGHLQDSVDFVLSRRWMVAHPSDWRWIFDPASHARREILRQNPFLEPLVGKKIITPFKPYDDLSLMLCALGYPRVIYVADGPLVFGNFGSAHKNWIWRGVKNLAAQLPSTETILCPAFLEESTRAVGKPLVVPQDLMDECYARIAGLEEVKQVVAKLTTAINRTDGALILSQNLYSGLATPFEDIRYYAELVAHAMKNHRGPVVFKPHPRDESDKLSAISDLCRHLPAKPAFLSQKEACVPVEVLASLLRLDGWRVYGACTSALMSCRDMLGMAPVCVTSSLLPETTNLVIREFAGRFQLHLEDLVAAPLSQDGGVKAGQGNP